MPIHKKKNELSIFDDSQFSKSNSLISASYNQTLLEAQLTSILIFNLQQKRYTREDGNLVCKLRAADIKKILNKSSGSFYTQLSETALAMTGRVIGFSDPKSQRFEYVSLINRTKYEDGVFTVKFSSDIEPYLHKLTANFTVLKLPTMLRFKSINAFRIYELIRSQTYQRKGEPKRTQYVMEFGLAELMFKIGLANAELDSVRKILNNSETPDYEKALEKSPEKMYRNWSDFRKRVIIPAIKEINEMPAADIDVDFEPIRSGKGGKVTGVIFYAQLRKVVIYDIASMTKEDLFDFCLMIDAPETVKFSDREAIAKAGNGNIQDINAACEYVNNSDVEVEDFVGYVIKTLKEGWHRDEKVVDFNQKTTKTASTKKISATKNATKRTTSKKKSTSAKPTKFSNFHERDNDYDDIERQLILNSMKEDVIDVEAVVADAN